ncbi:transglutaminase TgpA family protein [Deinococcus sp.]|uniref:transglutaminase TgpA family protein n=1 Tax=Deinococcus sp. TaxID=47478 RepID=UPI003CC57025
MTTLKLPFLRPRAAPPAPLPPAPLLLTLGALALSMGPYLPRFPLWLGALVLALLAGRALISLRGLKQPPSWTLVVAALLIGRGIVVAYSTLAGRDGGTALLVLLVALKTLESGRRRDLLLWVLLGYFLTASQFFFDQNSGVALYALLCALALTAALTLWARPAPLLAASTSPRAALPALRQSGRLLLQALPLTLALFVLFPRPDGPLWQMPVVGGSSSKTGLSDSVTPGSVSSLAQDDSVAFRATFQGQTPPQADLYWRGPVLEGFDGRRWRALPPVSGVQASGSGRAWRYRLTLESSGQPWGLALDVPTRPPDGTVISGNLQLIVPGGVNTRRQFDLESLTSFRYGLLLSPDQVERDTYLPAGSNPRARALAASWTRLPPEARVAAAYRFFQTDGLSYTLTPPLLDSPDAVDELLYSSKQGFCEHFASSFAYLMRAAGVPARLVTGYLGGVLNNAAGGSPYLIVRQADAHAWVEVWLSGRGWVRVDPTGAVSPSRLSGGLAAALPQSAAASLERGEGWLPALRLRLDAFQNAWNEWVIGYDFSRQQGLLSRLGLGEVGGARYAVALALLLVLGLLPTLLLRARRRGDPLLLAYRELGQCLRLPMDETETPLDYARRAAAARPQQAERVGAVTREYLDLRYGPAPALTPAQLRAFRRRVRG